MTVSRRSFVGGLAGAAIAVPEMAGATALPSPPSTVPSDRFDPWIEVIPAAIQQNVRTLSRLAGRRPILAVIKNNGYGLGLLEAARALEPMDQVVGFAVVKTEEAIRLSEAGVTKPILLMALFAEADAPDLVARGVHLALCTDEAPDLAVRAAERVGKPVAAHIYLDTGMSRMGVPYHRAAPFLERVARLPIRIQGTFTGLTEDREFDREQVRRLTGLAVEARARGGSLGPLHAASSDAVFNFPEDGLDLVRPGISLFGGYPSDAGNERTIATLQPALRLRARVVRVERLSTGDGVSYGRRYVAERPTWVATLPMGNTDGVPRTGVKGARVLIGGGLYPVIGAVSASHTIVELGDEPRVRIGDVGTLVGPDDPAIHPNAVASVTGMSVYDILMHLNPTLPKVVV